MHSRILTALAAVAFSAQSLFAGPLLEVELSPITHKSATLQVVGPNGDQVVYTPADLENFKTYRLITTTPWRDEPTEFAGVLLRDVLAANGLDAVASIAVTAENDYRTVLDRDLLETVDILVATRVDGQPHTRRARGPIQFVIDMETFTDSELASESNLVWMAARIEANS